MKKAFIVLAMVVAAAFVFTPAYSVSMAAVEAVMVDDNPTKAEATEKKDAEACASEEKKAACTSEKKSSCTKAEKASCGHKQKADK